MKSWYEGGIFARLKEINVDDFGISRLQTSARVNRVLNFNLPLDPWLKSIWDFAS